MSPYTPGFDFSPPNPMNSMTAACVLAVLPGLAAKDFSLNDILDSITRCSPTYLPDGPFPANATAGRPTGHEPSLSALATWDRFQNPNTEDKAAAVQASLAQSTGGLFGTAGGDVPVPQAFAPAYTQSAAVAAIAASAVLALILTAFRALISHFFTRRAAAAASKKEEADAARLGKLTMNIQVTALGDVASRMLERVPMIRDHCLRDDSNSSDTPTTMVIAADPEAPADPSCEESVFVLRNDTAENGDGDHAIHPEKTTPQLRQSRRHRVLVAASCELRAGRMTAIMGQSGAGKSMLLRAIARAPMPPSVAITGCVKADNEVVLGTADDTDNNDPVVENPTTSWTSRSLTFATSFMDQGSEVLFERLTARENVAMHSSLQSPLLSLVARAQRVQKSLSDVHLLEHLWDRPVGSGEGDDGGVSGGERRRVALACAIVGAPLVLLADEPTSGLDASSAMDIVTMLSRYAKEEDRIVALSVHQPSDRLFRQFGDVWLILQGKLAWKGVPESAELLCDAVKMATSPAQSRRFDKYSVVTTADYLVELTSAQIEAAVVKQAEEDDGMASSYPDRVAQTSSRRALNWMEQYRPFHNSVRTLLLREMRGVLRRPAALLSHLAFGIVLGLLLGLLYRNVPNTLPGVINRMGGFFFFLCLWGFASLSAIDHVFAMKHRDVLALIYLEYSAAPLVTARAVADCLLLRAIPAGLYSIIFYPLMGLAGFNVSGVDAQSLPRFGIFVAIGILYSVAMGIQAMFLASISPSAGTATLLASIVVLFEVLLGGFLINPTSMPPAVLALRNLSPFNHAFCAMCLNELKDSPVPFEVSVELQGTWQSLSDLDGSTFLAALGVDQNATVLQHVSVLWLQMLGLVSLPLTIHGR